MTVEPSAVPPPLAAYAPGSFALFTVQQRLPKILSDVRAQFDARSRTDPRWSALLSALRTGGLIDLQLFSPETSFWSERIASFAGRSWAELPFFELEFSFYLAIRSIANDLKPGFDVFAVARRSALADALPSVARAAESSGAASLEDALLQSTFGNEADLSQVGSVGGESSAISMLKDERRELVEHLRSTDPACTIQFLADNAGSELCFDLMLVDLLLRERSGPIELQLKPRPMFVSDALVSDVEETVAAFERFGTLNVLGRMSARLREAFACNRLTLQDPPDWAEPRAIDALDADVATALRSASLVLAKGDLNYRRFFEDRAWPAHTPVEVASVASGMNVYALRVLKSDSIVGLESSRAAQLFAADPGWRSSGRYAVIQQIDRGRSSPRTRTSAR